jgi:hypothetical protein
MQSTAITLVVVAATASLVSAAPAREETTGRISYNEHAVQQVVTDHEPGWIELASPTPASHGREFVLVGADAGTFTQLRLTVASGRPEIYAVRVDYQDGSHRVFEVNRVLEARHRPMYLDLRGAHELKQIVVVSDRRSIGSYVLEGNTTENVAAR